RSRRTGRRRGRARAPLVSADRVSCRRPPATDRGKGRGLDPRGRGGRRYGGEAATGGHLPVRRQRGGSRCHPSREIPAGYEERDSRQDVAHDRRGCESGKAGASRQPTGGGGSPGSRKRSTLNSPPSTFF